MAAVERGDVAARDTLFGSLYAELHQLARRELARHGNGAAISVTTLVHEAYLSMVGRADPSFVDRARFMGYAARVMRGVIIDHARERQAIKRGGQFEITSLATDAAETVDHRELTAISDALDELATTDRSLADVVDLRFFCGFSVSEIAAMFATSERTVHRKWDKARIFLRQYLRSETGEDQ
jgi:RNA polymerase sigma factor (TIGR02999 family)